MIVVFVVAHGEAIAAWIRFAGVAVQRRRCIAGTESFIDGQHRDPECLSAIFWPTAPRRQAEGAQR